MIGLFFSFDLCITESHWNLHILNYVMAGLIKGCIIEFATIISNEREFNVKDVKMIDIS